MPQQDERTLFAVIFEGRTGSSELMARLNSHPKIQAYPEILAPLCGPDISDVQRWTAVRKVFQDLYDGRNIETFYEAYSKQGAEHSDLPIRGLKTRLDDRRDMAWFRRVGKMKNFYVVESHRFMKLAAEYNLRLIRLRRRNLLKHAVSWIRAVQLSTEQGKWNIPSDEASFGPTVNSFGYSETYP